MCWVVVLEQAGGLHGVIRWFKFILGVFYLFLIFLGIVNGYCWSICDGYYLIVFNTCKHYILFCWKLVLWWVIMLEQTGGLNGDIRWFNIILGVFLIFLELWIDIVELLLYDYINFFFFNTCKHFILWCWWLVLWWVVVLEQVGGLHGDISWFNIILGVFLIFFGIVNEYCWVTFVWLY